MRPPSHMPLPAMMMAPLRSRLMALGILRRLGEHQVRQPRHAARRRAVPACPSRSGRCGWPSGCRGRPASGRGSIPRSGVAKQVQDFLGAADGEGGNEDVAPPVVRVLDDRRDLPDGGLPVPVQPVAVGAFHEHQVGLRVPRRVLQDRRAVLAEVAAEDQLALDAAVLQPDLDAGGTQDVPGIHVPDRHARQDLPPLQVGQGDELPQGLLHLGGRVQRLDQRQVLALAACGSPARRRLRRGGRCPRA